MRVVKRIWVNGRQETKLMPKGRVYKNLKRKGGKNVVENIEICNKSSDDTANVIRCVEEHTEKGILKMK